MGNGKARSSSALLCLHWAAGCGIIRSVLPEWAFVALTGDEDFNRGKMKKGNEQID